AETVLLLDSDRDHGEAIRTYLHRHQYEVTVVDDPPEILAQLENQKWNMLLGDPLIWGETTAVRIADLLKEDPAVQLIVYGTSEQVDRAMDRFGLDAVAYLNLPINSKALILNMARARNHSLKNRKIDRYVQRLTDLHTARNHFLQLFDSVPCFISVQDRNLRITAINKWFKQHFGNSVGGYCYQIYKHRSSPCEQCPVIQTFEDGQIHSTEEVVTALSGRQYHVLTHTAPIMDEKDEITQVMEISTNITQIRQLQDHLTSLGLMLGSMSHGVKGMLTALDGGIYQLETGLQKQDEARVSRAFEQVKTMTDKIRAMVLEILHYARSRQMKYAPVPVADIVEHVMKSVRPTALKNNVVCEVFMPDAPGIMEIDSMWMESALVNFLENAVDACAYDHEKPVHKVSLTVTVEPEKRVCFRIQDNGVGMDQETREKMFTLFFTSKGSRGTGLGLFIAHRVIQQHGGTVQVTSALNQGTELIICLPRIPPGSIGENGVNPLPS
ncbi:MAG: PAS domain-containing protein, partial [Desulfotignum sp.]|nr:PAS domain-containing protein [Desulfotignum sp.]